MFCYFLKIVLSVCEWSWKKESSTHFPCHIFPEINAVSKLDMDIYKSPEIDSIFAIRTYDIFIWMN